MKNKQMLILSIISVLTLMIFVIGATFAYLANDIQNSSNTLINTTTNVATSILLTDVTGDLSIDFENENRTVEIGDYIEGTAAYKVILYSSSNSVPSSCTFDLVYAWDDDSDEYIKTPEAENEFTIEGTPSFENVEERFASDNIAPLVVEQNLNIDETWDYKEIDDLGTKKYYKTLAKDIKLTNASTFSPTTVSYGFSLKFYNINYNQNALLDKKFKGKVLLENLNCGVNS